MTYALTKVRFIEMQCSIELNGLLMTGAGVAGSSFKNGEAISQCDTRMNGIDTDSKP